MVHCRNMCAYCLCTNDVRAELKGDHTSSQQCSVQLPKRFPLAFSMDHPVQTITGMTAISRQCYTNHASYAGGAAIACALAHLLVGSVIRCFLSSYLFFHSTSTAHYSHIYGPRTRPVLPDAHKTHTPHAGQMANAKPASSASG